MLSDSSDGPYMSDIAMQPSPTTETRGPFFPSCVVFTIRCCLHFRDFDDCRHIPYNVTMDRNKALVPANELARYSGNFFRALSGTLTVLPFSIAAVRN